MILEKMEIKIKEDMNKLEIEKNAEKLLKQSEDFEKLIILIFFLPVFGTGIFNDSTTFKEKIFIFIIGILMICVFSKLDNKYLGCNEIILIEGNDKIIIEYIYKTKSVYKKEIKLEDIKQIYTKQKPMIRSNIMGRNPVAKGIEKRRRLKILLFNGETHSWGYEVDDKDMKEVKQVIKKYFVEIGKEDLLDFRREYGFMNEYPKK